MLRCCEEKSETKPIAGAGALKLGNPSELAHALPVIQAYIAGLPEPVFRELIKTDGPLYGENKRRDGKPSREDFALFKKVLLANDRYLFDRYTDEEVLSLLDLLHNAANGRYMQSR
ncbi:MAG: hypothetical protein LBM12_01170 [Candidatus Nomurabacteria bacterium]|nr:hypothetical protein [Candidatus Nomurabacteria bacterium]